MHKEQIWRSYLDNKLEEITNSPSLDISEPERKFVRAVGLLMGKDERLGEEYCIKYRRVINEKERRLIGG